MVSACNGEMKPPSGNARRKGGCAFTRGCRSATLVHFVNCGTGPLLPGSCCAAECEVGGERTSRPKTAFSCAVAECGYCELSGDVFGWMGGSCACWDREVGEP